MRTAAPPRTSTTDLARQFILHTRAEPLWFAREVLNHKALTGEPTISESPDRSWELDQFQCDILEACADVWRKKQGIPTRINHEGRNYITVRSGHGPGKTHTAALVAHWFNSAFPGRIVTTAPKLAQLRTRVWSALRKVDMRAEPWYRSTHVIHDTTVNWLRKDERNPRQMVEDKDWCILAETASQPENIAGHHARFQLVIVEEATGVKEDLWPVIFGALSVGEIQILLMISNPTRTTGAFAASHLKASEATNYFRYHINLQNARRINREWVRKLEIKYGKGSPVVKVRAHGDFAENEERQLIALEWIAAARDREFAQDGSQRRLRVSVDCAAGGTAESVCMAMEHYDSCKRGLKMTRHSFELQTATVDTAVAAIKLFKEFDGDRERDDFVVDALGVGVGVAGYLRGRGYRVVFYQGGAGSDNNQRWRNRRVQSYIAARDELRDHGVSLDDTFFEEATDWDDFDAQMCSIKTAESEKLEDLEPKDKLPISPDLADCYVMQYATQVPQVVTTALRDPEMPEEPQFLIARSTINDGLM